MLDLLLLIDVGVPCYSAALFFFCSIERVVAVVDAGLCLVDLDDLACYLIKEITVVGYDQYGALVVEKIGLKPLYGIHIKMVSGLVQDDKVRLLEKELTEGNSCLLASGEGTDGLSELFICKAKTSGYSGDFALPGVSVDKLEVVSHCGVVIHELCKIVSCKDLHLFFSFADLFFKFYCIFFDKLKFIIDRIA